MSKDTSVLLEEKRVFKPHYTVVEEAHIKNWEAELEKGKDHENYWAEKAERFEWFRKWDRVLDESNRPFYRWFVNGKINMTYNAVDRWLDTDKRNQVAILYVNERGDERKLTYYELYREVNRTANALKSLGIKKGDAVALYLPMCPELVISMLACAKIGAVHSVIYSGLSVGALVERLNDARAKIIITADGTYRRGGVIKLKPIVDEAILQCPTIETTVVVKHTDIDIEMSDISGREMLFDKLIEGEGDRCDAEEMDAEDPLFILYTSGSTGKPKGVLHTTGGYMVGVASTLEMTFDIHNGDLWWCTADIGWITGHSYVVYGPLLLGTTTLLYEGAPDYPDPGVWWSIVEKYGVTKFYTAPTAIRHLMRFGDKHPKRYNLESLKILGTVGEPINPEAWMWYYRNIGREKCPIIDTWWQTETGMHLIAPLPVTPLKPGSVTKPLPGIEADVVDENGDPVPLGKGGFLVIRKPWPAMFRTLFNDEQRYIDVYWKQIPGGVYTAGDMARKDEDGYFWIQGRSDDVLNIAGHRIGTAEVESVFVAHPAVAEAAVIGKADPIKGEVIKAFLILKKGHKLNAALIEELKRHLRHELGPVAVVGEMVQVDSLPKTRSGKIMRRILRAREEGEDLGDTSTLEE
ncbi:MULTISPECIES: acetate--CoA ligase [Methanothermobacter]|jgi:acetyl-CoA synthetase|uniref:Acetate--CoA ligase n=2 Tax=Methanothermobacter TaxID=145260 RepID=A0A371NF19_9EURY|nr:MULTISPECIES: acetate--CoA ligase [Methanothermobacter]MDK2874579.1 acetyl-CoA synthetase [Methanothermobacter sp.]MDI6818452.1 acetate--CoA ligase [Methanothermobacter thermautotrophicus]MDN5373595.1 acetyl-CoA synthetase [Methanothermobacter sp.]REE29097.1 acetyl-coenzyme A synthetase [Methanothermobacter defluvii]WBF08330.1 acetate--CoA ligase [Methanothermobacter thermautotrophicus]